MKTQTTMIKKTMLLSSWSFVMVICSVLFGYVGLKIDAMLGTPPMLMTGFTVLGFFVVIMRLYNESINEIKRKW